MFLEINFPTGYWLAIRERLHGLIITTPSMQQFFMDNGYRVASGGKVFHGNPGKVGDALLQKPKDPKPPKGEDNFDAMRAPNDGYALDVADEEMGDYKVASWAIKNQLKIA